MIDRANPAEKLNREVCMRILLMIACLLFAANVHADQAKDADISPPQKEAPQAPTDWVNADEDPRFNDDESQEPSYSHPEQPSFQPDAR